MKRIVNDAPADAGRRGFLLGVGAALSLPVPAFASSSGRAGNYVRAVFQQQAYFDEGPVAESYQLPTTNSATHDYVASLSHEEFLRRHWFT